jgi:hypothetical protein
MNGFVRILFYWRVVESVGKQANFVNLLPTVLFAEGGEIFCAKEAAQLIGRLIGVQKA